MTSICYFYDFLSGFCCESFVVSWTEVIRVHVIRLEAPCRSFSFHWVRLLFVVSTPTVGNFHHPKSVCQLAEHGLIKTRPVSTVNLLVTNGKKFLWFAATAARNMSLALCQNTDDNNNNNNQGQMIEAAAEGGGDVTIYRWIFIIFIESGSI